MGQGRAISAAGLDPASLACQGQAFASCKCRSRSSFPPPPLGAPTSFTVNGACMDGPQMDVDEINAQKAAERAALEREAHAGIVVAKGMQGRGKDKAEEHTARTTDIGSPGGGNLQDPNYEASLGVNVANQRATLNAETLVNEGLQKELKHRMSLLRPPDSEMEPRTEMAGGEMESPYTGWPDSALPKRAFASGLIDRGEHSTGRRHVPSAFAKKDEGRRDTGEVLQDIRREKNNVKQIGHVKQAEKDAHKAESKNKHLQTEQHELDSQIGGKPNFHSAEAEEDMDKSRRNFLKQQHERVNADEAYQRKLAAIRAMQCKESKPGKRERPPMMSAEQPYYADKREVPNAKAPKPPMGSGPEIGYGVETNMPFDGLPALGAVAPRDIGIAKFPGNGMEAIPEEQEEAAMEMEDELGHVDEEAALHSAQDEAALRSPEMTDETQQESLPLVALYVAALAPHRPLASCGRAGRRRGAIRGFLRREACELREQRRRVETFL